MASFEGTMVLGRPLVTKAPLLWKVRNLRYMVQSWRLVIAKLFNVPTFYGTLEVLLRRKDGSIVNYGVVSHRVVTTAFVNAMQASLDVGDANWPNYKYHDCGTGTVDPAIGDTAMGSQYGGARATGSQEVGASANIYKTIGTVSFTGTLTITEHGVFDEVTSGTLMDRSTFTGIGVENGDSIQFTYNLTCTAGG